MSGVGLTEAEREALDERIAGGRWGYYIHFEPTGAPEVDRVLSAVGLAGKMYHYTEPWNDDDVDYGPIRKGESPVDFIQRAANDAARLLTQARAEGAREALEVAAREFAYTGPRMSDTGRQAVRLWLLDRAASAADLGDQGEEGRP